MDRKTPNWFVKFHTGLSLLSKWLSILEEQRKIFKIWVRVCNVGREVLGRYISLGMNRVAARNFDAPCTYLQLG